MIKCNYSTEYSPWWMMLVNNEKSVKSLSDSWVLISCGKWHNMALTALGTPKKKSVGNIVFQLWQNIIKEKKYGWKMQHTTAECHQRPKIIIQGLFVFSTGNVKKS